MSLVYINQNSKVFVNQNGKVIIKSSEPLTPEITPSTANLELWLDANYGIYDSVTGGSLVTTNGGTIARWEDRSGKERHLTQATINSRPTLTTSEQNGLNGLIFANDYIYIPSTSTLNMRTYHQMHVVVLKNNTTQSSSAFIAGKISRSTGISGSALRFLSQAVVGWFRSAGYHINSNTVLQTGVPYVITNVITRGTTNVVRINQTQRTRTYTGETGDLTNDSYYSVGGRYGTGGWTDFLTNVNVYEILIYQKTDPFTSQEILEAESYVKNKWGI